MDDQDLVQQLLKRQESNELDFKSQQYKLKDSRDGSKFVKDIAAMANTPRSEPAYILLGVLEQSGKVVAIPGVADHPDESELGRLVGGKVTPIPRFTYRQVAYKDLELGLIEIPCDQPGVVVARNDFGVMRRNAVYIRRNTQNIEAEPTDLADLFQTTISNQPVPPKEPAGAWEQLYQACDGFDTRRIYVALVDRGPESDSNDWASMAQVDWNIVVDFDTDSDTMVATPPQRLRLETAGHCILRPSTTLQRSQ